MKGFFSHGITMIVKDAVHKLVIHLYYAMLKLLKKYPSPQEMAGNAVERTQEAAVSARSQAGQMAGNVSELARQAGVTTTDEVQTIFEEAMRVVDDVKDKVNGNDT